MITQNVSYEQVMVGAHSTGALITMIYKKQLMLSSASNKKFDSGQIINFVQTDSQQLSWLSYMLPIVSTLPFILIFCISYLFYVLGWTFVFGFSVLSIGLFTNYKIAKRFGELREAYMKKQDARMDLTNETQ